MVPRDAARRIVRISDRLSETRKANAETVRLLLKEQRELWDSHFPMTGFEDIVAVSAMGMREAA